MASRIQRISSKAGMANWRQMMRLSLLRGSALFGAAVLGPFSVFYALALLTYDPDDRAFNSAAADAQSNWMGQSGAYLADAALFAFGLPAILLLPLMLVFARRLWRDVPQPRWKQQIAYCLTGLLLVGFGMAYWQHGSDIGLPAGWGGFFALLLDNGANLLVDRTEGGLRTMLRLLLIVGAIVGGIMLAIRSLELEKPLFSIPTMSLPKGSIKRGNLARGEDDDYIAAPIVDPKPPRKAVEPDNRKPPVIDDRSLAPKKAAFSTGARQGDFFGS